MNHQLIGRLPRVLPDTTPAARLPPALIVGDFIYLADTGPTEVSVDRKALQIQLNTTPKQTARGRTWLSGSGRPKPVTVQLTFHVQGRSTEDTGDRARHWLGLALNTDGYAEGASYLTVLGVLDYTEPFGEANHRSFSVTYQLRDNLWRLDSADPSPSTLPIQGLAGNYPLGRMQVVSTETDAGHLVYGVVPLADNSFTLPAPPVSYSYSDATFTYSHLLELGLDDSSVMPARASNGEVWGSAADGTGTGTGSGTVVTPPAPGSPDNIQVDFVYGQVVAMTTTTDIGRVYQMTMRCTASAVTTNTNATITAYSWDFGDAKPETGKSVAHLYSVPAEGQIVGNVPVKLTVTDSSGASKSVTKTILWMRGGDGNVTSG